MSEDLVAGYYAAMRVGGEAEEQMMALFGDDAVFDEPFSGLDEPAVGRDEIRDRLRAGWASPLPDMQLDVLTVTIDGATARCTWECRSPAFPAPVRGEDRYEFRDGRISRLEVSIDESG